MIIFEHAINSEAVVTYRGDVGMQPSSAFSVLKQLTNAGKWKILDKTLSLNVGQDTESVVSCVAPVAPLSDLNRDRMDTEQLVSKKLKGRVSEHDPAVAVGTIDDDILTVDKENMQLECMKAIDVSAMCTAGVAQSKLFQYNSLTDDHSERPGASAGDNVASGRCDAALKLCTVQSQQRKTFSLGAEDVSHSATLLQVQSDSLDVMQLIGEVAGMYQRSAKLSLSNTDDISTQEIEAHEDQFDGLKHQQSATPCAVETVTSSSIHSNCEHVSQVSEASYATAAAAGAGVDTGRLPLSVPMQTVQCADVHVLSSTACNTPGNMLPVSRDESQQLQPPATVDICVCSQSPADNNVARRARSDISCADEVAPDGNCEPEHSVSEEVLVNEVDHASDVDCESGEWLTPGSTYIYCKILIVY